MTKRPRRDRKPKTPKKNIVEEVLGYVAEHLAPATHPQPGALYPPDAVIYPTLQKLNKFDQL